MSDTNGNWSPPPPPGARADLGDRAGFWIRFVAHIVDSIWVWVMTLPISILAIFTSGDMDDLVNAVAFGFGVWLLARKMGSIGGSPWRVKLGVLVLDENDGAYIGTQRAVIRILMSYVSGLVLLLGYLWMLWDRNKQTWHDKVARTAVVRR